jgi:hypothetical protein
MTKLEELIKRLNIGVQARREAIKYLRDAADASDKNCGKILSRKLYYTGDLTITKLLGVLKRAHDTPKLERAISGNPIFMWHEGDKNTGD